MPLLDFLTFEWAFGGKKKRNDDIGIALHDAEKKLKRASAKLEAMEPGGDSDVLIQEQLVLLNEALDQILSSTN